MNLADHIVNALRETPMKLSAKETDESVDSPPQF
jgi:hypothetical protein